MDKSDDLAIVFKVDSVSVLNANRKVSNYVVNDPILKSGRCFGMCGEWSKNCLESGGVTDWEDLSEQRSHLSHIL